MLEKEIIFIKDLGMKFPTTKSNHKTRYGLYLCPYCNNEFEAITQKVKQKRTKSCGCCTNKIISQAVNRNKLRNHRLYGVWYQMIRRCTNPKDKGYVYYGSRGITVCESWLNIENFIKDMYPTFQEGLSIDRKNNNEGYNKENCRWVESTTQSRNTRVINKRNKSGYRGVYKCGKYFDGSDRWKVSITINYKEVFIGYFRDKKEGAIAFNNYILENKLEHSLNSIM